MPEDLPDDLPSDLPYDAVLLVSFGGPEGLDDVIPFLENVTRGRGIPRERLESVGEHYVARGGVSPINAQNRLLLEAIRADFAEHGIDLPVYWGNRNWAPYLADAVAQMADDGCQRALAFVTSAYSSYSGCRQYREDLAAARATFGLDRAPEIDKVRQYFDDPGFVDSFVDGTVDALGRLDPSVRAGARLVFTTHSLPESQAQTSGPSGDAYVTQHLAAADAVTRAVAQRTGLTLDWDLVYQSRSGPPTQPWLEPDVCDHLRDLHDKQAAAVVLVPIGFVSDHMEVVHDLDTEAAAVAKGLGLPLERAATAGVHPRFVAMVRELVGERLDGRADVKTCCPVGCCPNPRAELPSVAQCS